MARGSTREHERETDEGSVARWDYVASGERLTAQQERELTTRAQSGDWLARDRIFNANIPLVISIARRYNNPHLEAEDLIQEGMIGLCHAMERFDPERGFRFSTYATYWIKQRVRRALDRQGHMIHLPADAFYAARKAESLRDGMQEQLGREPTLAELADASGVSEQRLEAVIGCLAEPLSLDAPITDEGDGLTLDLPDPETPDPEQTLLTAEANAELEELLATLPSRDRLVLQARFGLNGCSISLDELASRLRVSKEAIRQLQRRALLKLQSRWANRQLRMVA